MRGHRTFRLSGHLGQQCRVQAFLAEHRRRGRRVPHGSVQTAEQSRHQHAQVGRGQFGKGLWWVGLRFPGSSREDAGPGGHQQGQPAGALVHRAGHCRRTGYCGKVAGDFRLGPAPGVRQHCRCGSGRPRRSWPPGLWWAAAGLPQGSQDDEAGIGDIHRDMAQQSQARLVRVVEVLDHHDQLTGRFGGSEQPTGHVFEQAETGRRRLERIRRGRLIRRPGG